MDTIHRCKAIFLAIKYEGFGLKRRNCAGKGKETYGQKGCRRVDE